MDLLTEASGYCEADSAGSFWMVTGHLNSRAATLHRGLINTYAESWPWELPGMIRVRHLLPWTNEEWTCIFTGAEEPYSDFSFSISGSVTGYDGTGRASLDFISDSKRIIIKAGDVEEGGDWHLKRSFKVLQTRVHPGDTIQWKTYSICTNVFIPTPAADPSVENVTTLFQGVENTKHRLQIIRVGKNRPPISEIRVYRPFWNRQDSIFTPSRSGRGNGK